MRASYALVSVTHAAALRLRQTGDGGGEGGSERLAADPPRGTRRGVACSHGLRAQRDSLPRSERGESGSERLAADPLRGTRRSVPLIC